jgi:hypothetical protein
LPWSGLEWQKSTNNQQVNLCLRNQQKKTPENQPTKKLTKFFKILWKLPFFAKTIINVSIVSKANSALIFQFCVNIDETYAFLPLFAC